MNKKNTKTTMRDPKDDDLIHIIDFKKKRIKAVGNEELCYFVNTEFTDSKDRYLIAPNAAYAEDLILK